MGRKACTAVFAFAVVLMAVAQGCEKQQPPPGTMEPMGPASGARPAAGEPDGTATPTVPAVAPAHAAEPEPAKPPPAGSVQLRWKLPEAKRLAYRVQIAQQPGPAPMKLDPAAIIKAGGLPAALAKALAGMGPPGADALTALLTPTYGTNLRVRLIGKDFEVPAQLEGDMVQRLVDAELGIELKGEITGRGEVQSASNSDEYAMLGLLFELPAAHVLAGDSWKLSVDLLRGGGVEVEKKEELDKVTLTSLKPRPGGEQLAVIEYALAVVEHGKRFTAEGEQPVDRSAVFVGRGELLVEAGHWQRFSGLLQTDDPTAEKRKTHTVLKLVHLPQVPKKFDSLD